MLRTGAVGYRENDADAQAVGKLADDVREAIIEYQVGFDFLVIVRMQC